MKFKTILATVFAIGLLSIALFGCPQAALDVQAADALSQCVIKDVALKETFEEVAADCAGATVQFVMDIVATLLTAEQNASDGGTTLLSAHLAKMHHK